MLIWRRICNFELRVSPARVRPIAIESITRHLPPIIIFHLGAAMHSPLAVSMTRTKEAHACATVAALQPQPQHKINYSMLMHAQTHIAPAVRCNKFDLPHIALALSLSLSPAPAFCIIANGKLPPHKGVTQKDYASLIV